LAIPFHGRHRLAFLAFEALLHANLDRVLEFLKTNAFTFSVNGDEIVCTVAEAILISPSVCDALQANPRNTNFSVASASIQSVDFGDFLAFARSLDYSRLPRKRMTAFISISTQLGNDPLAIALLSSLGPTAVSANASAVDDSTAKPKLFSEMAIDECASQFHSYSAEDLRLLNRRMLHSLLSSPLLTIESEDCLIRLLLGLELGVDRSEFLGQIEISLLSKEGLSLFLDEISLDEVSETIWQKIVFHLKGLSPAARLLRRSHPFPESFILQEIELGFKEFAGKSSALLYRRLWDGYDASAFHSKCDKRSNTLTIIEITKGYIFGGFTPLAWDSSNQEAQI
jgi:hypothetical protein